MLHAFDTLVTPWIHTLTLDLLVAYIVKQAPACCDLSKLPISLHFLSVHSKEL